MTTPERLEVEAESVAYVVCDILGLDAGEYSIPYVAGWSGADPQLVQDTAHRVLATARTIVAGLENELGVDLRPNPIADAIAGSQQPEPEPTRPLGLHVGTTDQLIADHLMTGPFDWQRLAASIPALERSRAEGLDNRPDGQAIVLAEAGASADATMLVLRSQGVTDDQAEAILAVPVPDSVGTQSTLYSREEVAAAIRSPRCIKPIVDAIYADLLVSAGRHPSAVRQLAESSGAPANVVALAEERARRRSPEGRVGHRLRGLELIDGWSSPSTSPDGPEPNDLPEPPGPPAA
jgi:hypothetical protein